MARKNIFLKALNWILPAHNRRRFKRMRAPFLLKYHVQESGVGRVTNLRDLSVGGVLFAAETPLLKDSVIQLEINLPTSEKPVSALAKVVRVAKVPNAQVYRIATKFNNLKPGDRKAIRILIERMQRDKHAKGLVNRKKRIWVTHE